MNAKLTALALLLIVAGAACGRDAPPSTRVARGTIKAEQATWLPHPSVQAWRDYADEVAIVRVTAEHRIEPTADEVARGEYWIGRKIDVVVERNLWAPHSTITASTFTAVSDGWMYSSESDKGLRRVVGDDSDWLEVGGRYVAALVRQDNGTWFPWSAQKLTDKTMTAGPIDGFAGLTPDQVAAQVRAASVSPAVAPYVKYSAKVRSMLVTNDKTGEADPTPMPLATTPNS